MKSYCLCRLIIGFVALSSLWSLAECRGERGRGIFKDWDIYKRLPPRGGRARKTGKPLQIEATKTGMPSPLTFVKQAPSFENYYHESAGSSLLPPGESYYANTAAIPAGDVYYAQTPGQGGGILSGIIAGHSVGFTVSGRHVHRQEDSSDDARKLIIINNSISSNNGTRSSMYDMQTVSTAPNATETSQSASGGIICAPTLLNGSESNDGTQQVQQSEKLIWHTTLMAA